MNNDETPTAPEELAHLGPLLPGGSWWQQAREYLQEAKARLLERHQQGASGQAIVEAYTAVVDHLLRALFAAASDIYAERFPRLNQRCAIIAQGGYGRGELNPCSDLDLLFLYQHRRDPYMENVAERILYTLWDTRLIEVGHAMRNVPECVRMAARELKARTALLDARFLCGDESLYAEFAAAMENDVLKRGPDRFFKEKLAENEERHQRYGDSVYILEPQLKEGEGGLRDLHTALWMAKVKFKTNSIPSLVQKGVITEREQEELERARDFLWRVRNSLHFMSGEHQDQLTFEYQERIALALGFRDGATIKGVEYFMRTYYLHAATINRFADQIIERCLERRRPYLLMRSRARNIRPGVTLSFGVLSIAGAEVLRDDPSDLIRLFVDAQRHGVTISNSTKRLVRANLDLMDDAQRRDPRTIGAFFDALGGKQRVYETLLDMHRSGVLGAFLPEFGALLCMVLHDVYHIYTVDEHSLMGVRELERLRAGLHKTALPMLTQVMREIDRVEILFLALILHDIGKGHGGGHSERGACMVAEITERLQLNTDDAAQLRFLVGNHLLMSHLAQRRDIRDQRLIIDFAKRVETVDNLRKLYLLTFGDMKAVGPKVWSNWHDMLLTELYLQTLQVFEREEFVEEDHTQRVDRIKQRVTDAAQISGDGQAVATFLRDMPDRYFLRTAEERILHHIHLTAGMNSAPVVCEVRHLPEREFSEFTVVTRDRPGLFSMLTGVLLAHGMNILGANINTSESGIALDIFRISHADQAEAVQRPERWERLQSTLGRCSRERSTSNNWWRTPSVRPSSGRSSCRASAPRSRWTTRSRMTSPCSTSTRRIVSACSSRSPTRSSTSACPSTSPRSPPTWIRCWTSFMSLIVLAARSSTRPAWSASGRSCMNGSRNGRRRRWWHRVRIRRGPVSQPEPLPEDPFSIPGSRLPGFHFFVARIGA